MLIEVNGSARTTCLNVLRNVESADPLRTPQDNPTHTAIGLAAANRCYCTKVSTGLICNIQDHPGDANYVLVVY